MLYLLASLALAGAPDSPLAVTRVPPRALDLAPPRCGPVSADWEASCGTPGWRRSTLPVLPGPSPVSPAQDGCRRAHRVRLIPAPGRESHADAIPAGPRGPRQVLASLPTATPRSVQWTIDGAAIDPVPTREPMRGLPTQLW